MPIVATDVGDVSNMIPDQRYGRVVRTGSITSLADGIGSLLEDVTSGRFQPDLLIERHRALYSIDKMVESIDSVYENLVVKA
jgi:glycosyltransferase involved in cell wall biosynthesis